jgi:hypothetical protein
MKQKWDSEKSERRAEGKKHLEKYKQKLMTDKEFPKQDKEKCQAEKERVKRKKMDWQNRKQRDEDMNILFKNPLGKTGFGDPLLTCTGRSIIVHTCPLAMGGFCMNMQF